MTPDERREFLASHGFRVATREFSSSGRGMFSMVEDLPTKQTRRPLYFIDLATGEWCLSGKSHEDWERGPWHELTTDDESSPAVENIVVPVCSALRYQNIVQRPTLTDDGRPVDRWFTDADLAFFDDCIAVGFEIVPTPIRLLDGYRDIGNQEARYQGADYLLICRTKSIMGPGCKLGKLSDFCSSVSVQRAAPIAAVPVPNPVPRPVLSEVRVRVEAPINTKQKSFFS